MTPREPCPPLLSRAFAILARSELVLAAGQWTCPALADEARKRGMTEEELIRGLLREWTASCIREGLAEWS
ncbi:hypothetical protein DYH09_35095 [bacterium CPR1]|nr:hypothetical protein [bacterium CPR1]